MILLFRKLSSLVNNLFSSKCEKRCRLKGNVRDVHERCQSVDTCSASNTSSRVRGCIIHSFRVVISAAPAVAVCFLSPVCTDLMICRSSRLRCLIQVSCHLTLLFSQPVRNLVIFKAYKRVI